MKTKSSSIAILAIFMAIAALLHADPPQAQPQPPAPQAEELAKGKVRLDILSKVSTHRAGSRFSRAISRPSHRLDFQPRLLVDGEQRLPFAITRWDNPKATPEWQGYVRLSDREIFLLNPKTGQHYPARENPLFAPPPPPKVEPAKPL